MAWTLTTPHNTARTTAAQAAANAKTLQLADAGAGPSTLRLYSDADPVTQERTHLVTIVLTKPCGTIVSGQIQLTQADPLGDMVAATGVPTFAQWCDGDGTVIADCTVSNDAGDGDLKISTRQDGMIFEGGFVTLTEGLIG